MVAQSGNMLVRRFSTQKHATILQVVGWRAASFIRSRQEWRAVQSAARCPAQVYTRFSFPIIILRRVALNKLLKKVKSSKDGAQLWRGLLIFHGLNWLDNQGKGQSPDKVVTIRHVGEGIPISHQVFALTSSPSLQIPWPWPRWRRSKGCLHPWSRSWRTWPLSSYFASNFLLHRRALFGQDLQECRDTDAWGWRERCQDLASSFCNHVSPGINYFIHSLVYDQNITKIWNIEVSVIAHVCAPSAAIYGCSNVFSCTASKCHWIKCRVN